MPDEKPEEKPAGMDPQGIDPEDAVVISHGEMPSPTDAKQLHDSADKNSPTRDHQEPTPKVNKK
jgi:hypothetical protein